MGTGEKSLLCNPGSELRLLGGGREKKEGEGNKWGGGKKRLSSAFECSYFLLPSPALRPATRAYRDAFTARMTYQIPGTAVGDAQTNPAGTGMTLTALDKGNKEKHQETKPTNERVLCVFSILKLLSQELS